jgi:hypothetical protein
MTLRWWRGLGVSTIHGRVAEKVALCLFSGSALSLLLTSFTSFAVVPALRRELRAFRMIDLGKGRGLVPISPCPDRECLSM